MKLIQDKTGHAPMDAPVRRGGLEHRCYYSPASLVRPETGRVYPDGSAWNLLCMLLSLSGGMAARLDEFLLRAASRPQAM